MRLKLKKLLSIWVVLGTLLVSFSLLIVLGLLLWVFNPPQVTHALSTAELSIIPAPTLTSTQIILTETPSVTLMPEVIIEGISKGVYVQIFDTGVAGLRLRNGPGINNPVQFLAPEGEVYLVEDGPEDMDGYIWWYLVAPYDQSRSGWAVSKYLKPVSATSQ
jgi:hypothetical protein